MTTRPPIDLEALREQTAPAWDELREQRVLSGVRDRIDGREAAPPTVDDLPLAGPSSWRAGNGPWRSPRVGRAVTVAAGAFAAAAAALLLWWTGVVGAPAPARVSLAEGVEARIDDEGTLRVLHREPGRTVALEQRGGTVAYDVDPTRRRQVEVWVSGVVVRVVGTVFVVADGDPVTVSVERGVVDVTDAGGTVRLAAGERRRFTPVHRGPFPDDEPTTERTAPRGGSAGPGPQGGVVSSPVRPHEDAIALAPTTPEPSARSPAGATSRDDDRNVSGDRLASSAPSPAPPDRRPANTDAPPRTPSKGRPTFEDLVARADRARQAGDLDGAASLYADALREPGSSGGRGTALFTLAVIEEQRGHHAAAARRFRAYRVRVAGSLTEEALAAEARNWRLAGIDDQAAAARRLYRSMFPSGQYADGL